MRPEDVISPVARTRNHVVLFQTPDDDDECWSIVEAEVSEIDEPDVWRKLIGVRWDGDRDDPDSKGFPNSSGKGVWFWVPTQVAPFFYGMIIPQLKERLVNFESRQSVESDLRKIKKMLSQMLPKNQAAAKQ